MAISAYTARPIRGGSGNFDTGISEFLPERDRKEIHANAEAQPFSEVRGVSDSAVGPSEKTIAEITADDVVHPTQVTAWKAQVLEDRTGAFGADALAGDSKERIREVREKLGRVTM